jgi:hypothetical protein
MHDRLEFFQYTSNLLCFFFVFFLKNKQEDRKEQHSVTSILMKRSLSCLILSSLFRTDLLRRVVDVSLVRVCSLFFKGPQQCDASRREFDRSRENTKLTILKVKD